MALTVMTMLWLSPQAVICRTNPFRAARHRIVEDLPQQTCVPGITSIKRSFRCAVPLMRLAFAAEAWPASAKNH
jgi:hypothetical protein